MRMQERLKQLAQRIPLNPGDVLTATLQALDKKLEDVQFSKHQQSSGATVWIAQ